MQPIDLSFIGPVVAALFAHKWIMAGALAVGALMALGKQGWFGPLIAKLPKRAIPWVAIGLSVLGTWAASVLGGAPALKALGDAAAVGLSMALAAVTGHELVIESVFGGKELLPAAPWKKKSDATTIPPSTLPPV